MPTDNAGILELVQAICKIIPDLTTEGLSLSNITREKLVENAERLAIAAREPQDNLYFQATQTAQNSAIRTAINMGVFESIPSSGSGISATELSATLKVDECLLSKSVKYEEMQRMAEENTPCSKVRIMRACTSTHLFHEVSPLHYTHNAFSAIFRIRANRDMFVQMYDFLGRGVYTMPYFLASTDYRNPIDHNNSAFQYGHHTHLGFWEYMKEDPERMRVFNNGMQSLATVGGAARSAGPYPFDKEIGREEVGDADVLIVDVGGGKGQVLEAIKAAFPSLKGRMVLQDVSDVIEDAQAGGLPGFIEPMAASYYERQPIEGALIYHFRRIFHDWSDDVALVILRNTVQAMNSRSRLLITDTVVPEMGAPRHIALQDINMMSFGGMERTRLQWKCLLGRAGLNVKTFWSGDGNLHNTIEAVLK